VRFEKLPLFSRARAYNLYKSNSEEYIIQFMENWLEIDFAHELTHGYLMFIDNIPLILCTDPLCQLIRDMEDIVVHRKIFNIYKEILFDKRYLDEKIKWTRDLFKRGNINDTYWDPKGQKCKELHKSFLYLQAWDFYKMTKDNHLERFLESFRRSYKNKIEYELASLIIQIIKKYNNLSNKEDYENTLKDILQLLYLNVPISVIKYYEKDVVGNKLR